MNDTIICDKCGATMGPCFCVPLERNSLPTFSCQGKSMFSRLKLLKDLPAGTLFRWTEGNEPTCLVLNQQQMGFSWGGVKPYTDGNYYYSYLSNGWINAGGSTSFVYVKG